MTKSKAKQKAQRKAKQLKGKPQTAATKKR